MITKELKDYTFTWNDVTRTLTIARNSYYEDNFIPLDKVRMLSLMRFMIRVMQHLSVHRHAKISK
jgi:hypothetical protein